MRVGRASGSAAVMRSIRFSKNLRARFDVVAFARRGRAQGRDPTS